MTRHSTAVTRLAWAVGLALVAALAAMPRMHADEPLSAPSILRPNNRISTEYRFPIDAIDPSAAGNPKGAALPGFRGENQMVIYTPAFGPSTRTNEAGHEAVVQDGLIVRTGGADNAIPPGGLVLSAHGSAAQWLTRFAKPGAQVEIDAASRKLLVRHTPAVYLGEVDVALQRAESRSPAQADRYQTLLAEAKACRAELALLAVGPVTRELADLSRQCRAQADQAFYNTFEARPGEFRGAWIRPDSIQPEDVRKTVDSLKANRVEHVFLETYFQGKTAYPSDVMAEYGLPVQHARYQKGDPVRLWVDEAHRAGLKVHLWVQVYFAGNQRANAEQYGPILQKYPEWRNIQRPYWNVQTPMISDIEPGHYFLDPANPQVKAFLEKLLLEMIGRYEVDGLNLDYIRYPASAAPDKSIYLNTTWGYTESARKQFQAMLEADRREVEAKRVEALQKAGRPVPKATDKTEPLPDPKDLKPGEPLWPRWVSWRQDQVTGFVKDISAKATAMRPGLRVSAVVFPSGDAAYAQKLQDYPRWVREGYVHALTPIGLSPRPEWMYHQALKLKQQTEGKAPVYVGIFALYNRQGPIEMVEQIDAVHRAGLDGVVFFDWSRLAPDYAEALQEGPFRQ